MTISNHQSDLLAAIRIAERSISILVDDLDDLRQEQRRDHEALVRAQEQLQQVREQLAEERRTQTIHRGQHLQATATIAASIIGMLAGAASLVWQILHR